MNKSIYTIIIPEIKIFAYHGCYEQEKRDGQEFEINMNISFHKSNKIHLDNLINTIDYVDVESKVKQFFTENRYNLLETIAFHLSEIPYSLQFQNNFKSIFSVEVSIRKNNPMGMSVPHVELKYINYCKEYKNLSVNDKSDSE